MSAFPEYSEEHLTTECRAQLHGAAGSFKKAHEALLRNDLAGALNEMEFAIEQAQASREYMVAGLALKK